MKRSNYQTDFLFPTPSALRGIARMFDFSGRFDQYNISDSSQAADAKALYSDWAMVGESFRSAIDESEAQSQEKYEDAA